jgi:hypothetical protein
MSGTSGSSDNPTLGTKAPSAVNSIISLFSGLIALIVISTVCYIAINDYQTGVPILSNIAGVIIGFYFGTQVTKERTDRH